MMRRFTSWACVAVVLLLWSVAAQRGPGGDQRPGYVPRPTREKNGLVRSGDSAKAGRGGRKGPRGKRGPLASKSPKVDIERLVSDISERRQQLQAWGEYAGGVLESDADASLAVQEFFKRFYNARRICSSSNWKETSVSFMNRGAGEGLGSLLNGYLISAMWAMMQGKRLCTHKSMTFYISKESCPSQTWDCIFKPVSESCPCQDIAAEQVAIPELKNRRCYDSVPLYVETLISNGFHFKIYDSLVSTQAKIGGQGKGKIVLPRRNDHWYMAQLYHYFLRPNKELEVYMKNLKQSLFPDWDPTQTISVHIRRGDHWMGGHLDDEAYLFTIRRVAETAQADTVFLGSDDFEVLRTFPEKLAPLKVLSIPSNYTILHNMKTNCEGRNRGCKAADYIKKNTDGSDEGKLLMTQIYLMKETLVTIGTIGSNFGRVIHQLQWADKASKQAASSPAVHFLDMEGDSYFACGWRLSQHQERSNKDVVEEWTKKYKYWKQAQLE